MIYKLFAGIGLLILMFLLLTKWQETRDIILNIGESTNNTIRTLQGRK